MTHCWEEEPQSRPSFTSLAASVGNLLPDDYKKVSHSHFFSVSSWITTKTRTTTALSDYWLSVSALWSTGSELPDLPPVGLQISWRSESQHRIPISQVIHKLNWPTTPSLALTGSPASQAEANPMEVEPGEVGPTQSSYIIPVGDVIIEKSGDAAQDAVRYDVTWSHWHHNNRINNTGFVSDVAKWESDAWWVWNKPQGTFEKIKEK